MFVKHRFAALSLALAAACSISIVAAASDDSRVYLTAQAISAKSPPAKQFAFLIGRWQLEQLYPATETQEPSFNEWKASPDGSLVGKIYDNAEFRGSSMYEERIVVRGGKYVYFLSGQHLPPGGLPPLPIVQGNEGSVVVINSGGHWPARVSYDLMKDGSVLSAVFVRETGYELFKFKKL